MGSLTGGGSISTHGTPELVEHLDELVNGDFNHPFVRLLLGKSPVLAVYQRR
jgi:hypothetical protein